MKLMGFGLSCCALMLATSELYAAVGERNYSKDQFNYTLYTTDVIPWVVKKRSGLVMDEAGLAAMGVQKILRNATQYLNMALYGVQKETWFLDQLKSVKQKKVRVRAVVDQDGGEVGEWRPENFTYKDTVLLKQVLSARSVVPDQGQDGEVRAGTIMHNKFLTADQRWVWMGSSNLTHTCLGAEYNANASMLIDSPELAAIYDQEFNQMFDRLQFSIYKEAADPQPTIRYKDGTEVSVFFSPKGKAIDLGVLPFIEQAQSSIDIAMFYLTHLGVVEALGQAVQRGVRVRLIYDAVAAAHPSSRVKELRDLGVEVRVENWGGKMHMKSAIADLKNVIMGSMNWTDSGDTKNDENTLLVNNNVKLAREMSSYFQALWRTLDHVKYDARAESLGSINSCFDGVDNDHDGRADEKDSGCKTTPGGQKQED